MAEINASFKRDAPMDTSFETIIRVTDSGSSDYNSLVNQPKINEVKLIGNRSLEELGLNSITNIELEELLK
ncbi:hypothetical protein Javan112_0010 [Streptococcus phage Javan112]|jgi:hypothetical protein|uniref:Conserved domain protein n=1 Tax=Streptococcus constellatus subsp. pharyngis SK1060 = CCUG 46377 TaxID=1035184 RepID=F9P912_STRCV|nr:hypothetical protein [Streptococcus constellatus]QBX13740.1 hypothetical protein Javan105_0010 [Streptococcus phage Javan105]QBX22853.1 hypothetical protein Javan102_0009 [Streptococcus phage Javan102]QBX22958.1 hypothetical protein Javan108_0010 [Streptococcus phage Javan108]QBX23074.1 hypothetical protein Javan112_0010 [Streptococcus phage Javan112]DAX83545.1 MAG TPA: hypothetical protein [Caudoviricetes sp.]